MSTEYETQIGSLGDVSNNYGIDVVEKPLTQFSADELGLLIPMIRRWRDLKNIQSFTGHPTHVK